MKLYATVTTDRASKGQGGNHQLETVYQAETDAGRVVVGRTIMTREEDGYRVRHIPVQGDTTEYRVPVRAAVPRSCPECGQKVDEYYNACTSPDCDWTA